MSFQGELPKLFFKAQSIFLTMFRPDETLTTRELIFELRNGAAIPQKHVDKIHGEWREVNPHTRLVMQDYGQRLDAERRRKHDVILQILFDEAARGHCYTANQFSEAFEGKAGLGASRTINERLSVLATQGYIKFFRNPQDYGLTPVKRSKFGYLCVEDMRLTRATEPPDPDSGEIKTETTLVLPTHYKCPQTGSILPVENPEIWVYQEDMNS